MRTINSYKDYFIELNKCESKEQEEILDEKLNSSMAKHQEKEIMIVEEKIKALKQARAKGTVTTEELRRILEPSIPVSEFDEYWANGFNNTKNNKNER